MDASFAAEMRVALERMREALQADSEPGDDPAGIVELDQQRVGRLSRMDAMQAQAMAQASGRRREDSLRAIAAALARLDSDDYGYCLSCGKAINKDRLRVDPTAAHCIDCANRAESSS